MIQTADELVAFRAAANNRAGELKDPQYALERLFEVWANSSESQRKRFDEALATWVSSDDALERFDAEAIIGRFCRTALAPNLLALRERLNDSLDPGAPYEKAKIDRLLEKLSGEQV
jgi:hypothetical protein